MIHKFVQTVDIKYAGHPVKFYIGSLGPMAEGEFSQKEYDRLRVEGRDVIDIGAAVGDTAIILALRGANRVLGYELNKRYFDIAKRNIEINRFEDNIALHYCGIASRKINESDDILGALIPDQDSIHVNDVDFCPKN